MGRRAGRRGTPGRRGQLATRPRGARDGRAGGRAGGRGQPQAHSAPCARCRAVAAPPDCRGAARRGPCPLDRRTRPAVAGPAARTRAGCDAVGERAARRSAQPRPGGPGPARAAPSRPGDANLGGGRSRGGQASPGGPDHAVVLGSGSRAYRRAGIDLPRRGADGAAHSVRRLGGAFCPQLRRQLPHVGNRVGLHQGRRGQRRSVPRPARGPPAGARVAAPRRRRLPAADRRRLRQDKTNPDRGPPAEHSPDVRADVRERRRGLGAHGRPAQLLGPGSGARRLPLAAVGHRAVPGTRRRRPGRRSHGRAHRREPRRTIAPGVA